MVKWLSISVLLLMSSIIVVSCARATPTPLPPEPIVATVVRANIVNEVNTVAGFVEFDKSEILTFENTYSHGQKIKELNVKIGDTVTTGQLLAVVEDDAREDAQLAFEQAGVALINAQAKLEKAMSNAVNYDTFNDALDSYKEYFIKWFGVELSSAQLNQSPTDILASWGLTFETLENRLSGLTTGQDDPSTPWSEIVVFTWQNLFPIENSVDYTCPKDYEAGVATIYCIQDELRDSWDAVKKIETENEAFDSTNLDIIADLDYLINDISETTNAETIVTARVEFSKAKLDYRRAKEKREGIDIVSTIDGMVVSINFKQGDRASETAKLTITDPNSAYADIEVPEINLIDFLEANSYMVEFLSYNNLQTQGSLLFRGFTRTNTSTGGSLTTGNYQVKIGFDQPEKIQIPQGSLSRVTAVRRAENVLVVPRAAVVEVDGVFMVDVVSADGSLVPTEVEIGISDIVNTEIVSGLKEGDMISYIEAIVISNVATIGGGGPFGDDG